MVISSVSPSATELRLNLFSMDGASRTTSRAEAVSGGAFDDSTEKKLNVSPLLKPTTSREYEHVEPAAKVMLGTALSYTKRSLPTVCTAGQLPGEPLTTESGGSTQASSTGKLSSNVASKISTALGFCTVSVKVVIPFTAIPCRSE